MARMSAKRHLFAWLNSALIGLERVATTRRRVLWVATTLIARARHRAAKEKVVILEVQSLHPLVRVLRPSRQALRLVTSMEEAKVRAPMARAKEQVRVIKESNHFRVTLTWKADALIPTARGSTDHSTMHRRKHMRPGRNCRVMGRSLRPLRRSPNHIKVNRILKPEKLNPNLLQHPKTARRRDSCLPVAGGRLPVHN